ncbi:MAG: hypothetical protein ACC618_00745 [Patescibacteria group bacterium]
MEGEELKSKLEDFLGRANITPSLEKELLDLETRRDVLTSRTFDKEDMEEMMPIEAENLDEFAKLTSETFEFSPLIGKDD